MKKTILLSLDIEDWFQVENFRKIIPHKIWDKCELRVEKNTKCILDLLDKHNIKATFFVLGWIADKLPSLINDISKRGHEIACHGYYHKINYYMSKNEVYNDIKKAKIILEDLTGKSIEGYRAPNFSISEELFDVLERLNFSYDSSYHPFFKNKRYGRLKVDYNNNVFLIRNKIVEISMSVFRIFDINISIAGGGYFRLMPYKMFKYLAFKYLNDRSLLVLYFHPWEFDSDQPRVYEARWDYKFRHYYGIKRTFGKLNEFIIDAKKKGYGFKTYKYFANYYLNKRKQKNE